MGDTAPPANAAVDVAPSTGSDVTDEATNAQPADTITHPAPPATAGLDAKLSGLKPPASRIGRPCTGHGAPKAGPPPPVEPTQNDSTAMRRQPDEYSRSSHLSDVYEESEAELLSERHPDRSTKSRSPSEAGSSLGGGGRSLKGDRKVSSGSLNSEHYLEATGKRRNSDQSVVLTADTDSFIIGQRIWVGGQRPGHIAYIGETHFAPGDWAGIVLDDPSGKNDGCVSGKRYFQCEPRRGIFSRLTRLTREPLAAGGGGGDSADGSSLMNLSTMSSSMAASPARSGAVSPSQSVRSYATNAGAGRTPGKGNLSVGDRIIVSSGLGSRPGILKYVGDTHFAIGTWCGVQLDEPSGKNDGSVDGQRYFECLPNYGIFVPIAKVSLSPSSRKTRLSRAGSKESLTSVGTIGSMASTVTSRMRLSGVQQRLSTPAKPITTSKHTVALQDILREKQNHIEQLLLERELEKQDSESQIIAYQKDINQLKVTISGLELRLLSESKRTEDLQVTIEEATFCGDELNAQTQDYCERIAKLEAQLAVQRTTDTAASDAAAHQAEMRRLADELATKCAALESARTELQQRSAELAALGERFNQSESDAAIKLGSLGVSEQCLREEIKFVQSENDQLKLELRNKDEATEKEYLAMRHIEHELKEELAAAQAELQLRDANAEQSTAASQRLDADREAQLAELRTAAAGAAEVHQLELNRCTAELQAVQAELAAVRTQSQSLTADSSGHLAEIQRHIGEIAAHKQTICETSALVVRLQNEAAASEERFAAQTAKLQAQTEAVQELRSENGQLRAAGDEWAAKFENMAQSNANLSDVVLRERDAQITELREQCAQSVAACHRLTERSTQLDGDIERLHTESANWRTQNATLQQRNDDLASELAALKNDREADAQLAVELRERIALVERQETDGCGQIATLQQEIVSLKKLLDESRAQTDELRGELSKQAGVLAAAATTAEDRARDISAAQQDADRLQQQLAGRAAELDKSTLQIAELHGKLELAAGERSTVSAELAALQVDHADVRRQFGMLEQKLSLAGQEKASLQQQLDALQSTSSDASGEMRRLHDELQQRQRAHDELVDKANGAQLALERKAHELTQQLAAQTTLAERAREELDALRAQTIERENELNAQLARAQEQAQAERGQLAADFSALREQHAAETQSIRLEMDSQSNAAQAERQALQANVERLNGQVLNLTAAAEASHSERIAADAALNQRIADLTEADRSLQQQLAEHSASEAALRERLTVSNEAGAAEIAALSAALRTSEQQVAAHDRTIAQLLSEAADAATSTQQTGQRINELTDQLEQMRLTTADEKQRLSAALAEQTARNALLDEQFKTTEDDQVDLVNKNLEMVEELQLLRQQLAEADEQQTTAAAQLADRELQIVALQSEHETLQTAQQAVEQSLAEQRSTAEHLQQTVNELSATVGQQSAQSLAAQTDLGAAQAELSALRQQHDADAAAKQQHINALEEKISMLTNDSVNLSDDLKNELNAKSAELRSRDDVITELSAELSVLRAQVQTQTDALQLAETDRERSKQQQLAEVSRLQDKLELLERSARDSCDAANSERDALGAQLEAMRAENVAQQKEFEMRLRDGYVERAQLEASQDLLTAMTELKRTEAEAAQQQLADVQTMQQRRDRELAFEKVQLQRREEQLQLETRLLAERQSRQSGAEEANVSARTQANSNSAPVGSANDDSGAQIAFLNSIIADMQKKNENLLLRISALEESPQDFIKNSLYDVPFRREPAPRMFCDICDVFDAHETEDCPLQSSGTPSPPPVASSTASPTAQATNTNGRERKVPPPRKYCDLCEAFGHEASECDVDQTF